MLYAPPPPVLIAPLVVEPPRRSAPVVVHVLAVLQYLGGVAALAAGALFAYLTVVLSGDPGSPDDFIDPQTVAVAFGLLAGFLTACGLVGILLARQLQRGRQWARVVLLILSGLNIVIVVGSMVIHSTDLWTAVFAIYPVLCIALLNVPAARAWLRA